jgi:dTMP kinase
MVPPRYLAFEGVEGCGKSTQAARLADRLGAVLTRETGGTGIGQQLRHVLHDPSNTHLDPVAEALMIAADRAQHRAEIIEPALAAGRTVVSDRSVWSSLAYQGFGRGLPPDTVRSVNHWALQGRWPDVVVFLDVPHEVVAERLQHRELDRFEQEDEAFFQRVANGFRTMAAADPTGWIVVDGSADADAVTAQVWQTLHQRGIGA